MSFAISNESFNATSKDTSFLCLPNINNDSNLTSKDSSVTSNECLSLKDSLNNSSKDISIQIYTSSDSKEENTQLDATDLDTFTESGLQ